MAGLYRIADEPAPGRLSRLAVNPLWPLLATMLGGFWLGLPWFALNAAALGSATRRREWAWIGAGLLVTGALGFALIWGIGTKALSVSAFRYALVGLVALRLVVAYAVCHLQQATFELWRHFGQPVRNGALLVVAAAVLRPDRLLPPAAAFFLDLLVG
jgi:hypothetical protein